MALNERRRRGILVAPGVSPGTASSFPYQARFSGRQSQYGGTDVTCSLTRAVLYLSPPGL